MSIAAFFEHDDHRVHRSSWHRALSPELNTDARLSGSRLSILNLELPSLWDVRLFAIFQHLFPSTRWRVFPREALIIVVLLPIWLYPPALASDARVHFGLAQNEYWPIFGDVSHAGWLVQRVVLDAFNIILVRLFAFGFLFR